MSNLPSPPSSLAATVVLESNTIGEAPLRDQQNLPIPVTSHPSTSALYVSQPGATNSSGLIRGSVRESEGADLLLTLAERERAVAAREARMQQWEKTQKEREEKTEININVNSESKEEDKAPRARSTQSNLPLIFAFSPAGQPHVPARPL
jgi:hypothetical protein